MNWNTKYIVLVIVLIISLVSVALNGLVTITILVITGFVFWVLQVTKKYQSKGVTNNSEVKSQM